MNVKRSWWCRVSAVVVCCALCAGTACKKKDGEEGAAGGGGGKEELAYRQPERGTDDCSVICGKECDESIIELHRDWIPDDDEYRKSIEDTYRKKVEFETECRAKCGKLLEAGGPAKELVDKVKSTCMDKESLDFAVCIGTLNEELRQSGSDDPPQW